MMHGAFFFASSNISRTRDAPTPTNISTKSEPEILKNGTPASPAIAFARSVLPVPGAPSRRTPLGILAPTLVNLAGFLRNSTISSSSAFSSFSPATSVNLVLFAPASSFARLFPKFIILDPPPAAAFCAFIMANKNTHTTTTINIGRIFDRNQFSCGTFSTRTSRSYFSRIVCSSVMTSVE